MNLFAEHAIYEVVCRDAHYSYLEFIRLDKICDVYYITWKNLLTNEMYTFEESEILSIHERGKEVNESKKDDVA